MPDFIFRLRHRPTVLVESDLDVEFFRCGFPRGDLLGGLGADCVETHFFGEGHDFSDFCRIIGLHHAVIDGVDALALALGKQCSSDGFACVVRDDCVIVRIRTEFLAGIKFDNFPARLLGLGDGFEGTELLERVSLAADGDTLVVGFRRNRSCDEMAGDYHEE